MNDHPLDRNTTEASLPALAQNHHDVIASVDELDRIKAIVNELFADRLEHIALDDIASLISASDRMLASPAPDDVRIEEARDLLDVSAVEGLVSRADASDRCLERVPVGSLVDGQSPSVGTGFSPE